jgi:alkylation response protein AidB-like acyl-CoA dehydrogenase
MDFAFSEDQVLLRNLAREILEKELTPERLKAVEAEADWFDAALWSKLAEASLLGLAVPERLGGMGLGLLELCVLLHEAGRTVAPVPLLATLVLGGLPLAERGTPEQQARWLVPMARGEAVLTAALVDADSDDPARPATRAERDGTSWLLTGAKRFVPAAHLAQRILVPATTGTASEASHETGVGLFLVDPHTAGVALGRHITSTGEPIFDVRLENARCAADDRLGGDVAGGTADTRRLHEQALVALSTLQLGVSERALEITTSHARERVQFGVPIGSFQAVQHRAADCFVDLVAMRWTAWRAAWRLAEGRPAAREAAVAKYWAAEGGFRVASAAQHLHGGLGVDLDYPVHRHFLWARSLELALGGATPQLAWLGRDMARAGPQETP